MYSQFGKSFLLNEKLKLFVDLTELFITICSEVKFEELHFVVLCGFELFSVMFQYSSAITDHP